MTEFFLELLSEDIPPKLQVHARENIKISLEKHLADKSIKFNSSKSFSTPKRLVFFFDGLPEKLEQKAKVLKGPKIDAPKTALEGFIKSNNLNESDIFEKEIEKGRFYFAKTQLKTINVAEEFEYIIPIVLKNYSWKKAMKWSTHDLSWARPLKSILALFNNKVVNFSFFHLKSNNVTFWDENFLEKPKKIYNFKSYLSFLDSQKIVLDQDKRKNIIVSKIKKICISRKFQNKFSENLINEVTNLVERPNIITGKFDKSFLNIPSEILTVTMQQHQKYFPLFDENDNLTNFFLIVTNLPDEKGYIKAGNEKVINARLSDAQFFWEKNKKQNLIKQVIKLKSLSFYNRLGSIYDKTQRLKKLGSLISEHLNLSKEKIEVAASICKADLVSDLVGEYPELQGVMGKYFAKAQGFDEDISLAISDHYLPTGVNSLVSKKPISYAVALADKLDTLVGFFGIDEKPTSSKDPFALRRCAIGLLKTILENNLVIRLKELINYSMLLYSEQNFKLTNSNTSQDLLTFLRERIKNILKDKKIRNDIIEASISLHAGDDFISLYKKSLVFNKNISNEVGKNIISTYKRASNILDQELKKQKEKIIGQPDSILFRKEEEKFFFEKINEIRKYFSTNLKKEDYTHTLQILAEAKNITDNFFDNVIVNDDNLDIKKNRLELLQMFCMTYNNFIDFSKVEGA